ncbi:hypothetical protein [Budvicia aquatica]|uniref:Uncharacterized protein n=1 Tax=Budvicia aquatica TaxID=82979 RepID=A0A484ZRJ1_9GAMM|nr:hypothetical protein [Budvicia aquatica]VFS51407.1 Uncharacterised protein [Budvicia aquatica]
MSIESDSAGDFTYGWITTLIQTLKLGLGESPFYVQYGIPAQRCIVEQFHPDFYVNMVQQQFAGYFASITIKKHVINNNPVYDVSIVTLSGVTYQETIAV